MARKPNRAAEAASEQGAADTAPASSPAELAGDESEAIVPTAQTDEGDARPDGAPQAAGEVSSGPAGDEASSSAGAEVAVRREAGDRFADFGEDRLADFREALLQAPPEQLAELKAALASLPSEAFVSEADREERRPFAVLSDLHHDGVLFTPAGEERPRLTRVQFEHLRSTGTVEGEWGDSEKPE